MKKLTFILLLTLFLISSCSKQENSNTNINNNQDTQNAQDIQDISVEQKCIDLCLQELDKGTNLENGPCLSNEIQVDWVCDIAHNPRQSIDNQQENQCSRFRQGLTHHFVEVSPECNFIRKF
ncbi:MAG: hypothetical protein V1663_00605 [archaeon]